jgi:hypothetical protein
VNDTTFNKLNLTDTIFSNVNDTNYIVYAPQVTKDGLELYYTRILKSTVNSEICVSMWNSSNGKFSLPSVIHSNLGFVPEAASPSLDKQKLYYHQKDGSGLFRIYLRNRLGATNLEENGSLKRVLVYPNPTKGIFYLDLPFPNETYEVMLYSGLGIEAFRSNQTSPVLTWDLPNGIYYLQLIQRNQTWTTKLVVE